MLRTMLGLGMILDTRSYRQGRRAFAEGQPITANPHYKGSSMWADWALGWRMATKLAAMNENRELARNTEAASAYELGEIAAANGLGVFANPYLQGNPAHDEWRLGWAARKAS